VLFAMAYGGNGITYSAIGAHILADAARRKPHPLAALFGFERDSARPLMLAMRFTRRSRGAV